jgi:hypothetical protein
MILRKAETLGNCSSVLYLKNRKVRHKRRELAEVRLLHSVKLGDSPGNLLIDQGVYGHTVMALQV